MPYYFYECGFIDKPNIQTFGRRCLTHAANTYKNEAVQAKLARYQMQQQLIQQRQVQRQHLIQQQNLKGHLVYHKQQEKQQLRNIDDILAEEKRRILTDFESLAL